MRLRGLSTTYQQLALTFWLVVSQNVSANFIGPIFVLCLMKGDYKYGFQQIYNQSPRGYSRSGQPGQAERTAGY